MTREINRLWEYMAALARCRFSDASEWYRRGAKRGVDALL